MARTLTLMLLACQRPPVQIGGRKIFFPVVPPSSDLRVSPALVDPAMTAGMDLILTLGTCAAYVTLTIQLALMERLPTTLLKRSMTTRPSELPVMSTAHHVPPRFPGGQR